MHAVAMDHVNLTIPADRVDDAIAFYEGALGFEAEALDRFRAGDRGIFTFRLGPSAVIHVRPTEDFDPPSGRAYDHVAVVVDDTIDAIRSTLDAAGIDPDRESTPLGATGRAPAVYVTDPFGYTIELKAGVDPAPD